MSQCSVIQEYSPPVSATFTTFGQTPTHASTTVALNPDPSTPAPFTNDMTQMDGIPYSQSMGAQGLVRTGSNRMTEQMMGLSYLSDAPSTETGQHSLILQQVCGYSAVFRFSSECTVSSRLKIFLFSCIPFSPS